MKKSASIGANATIVCGVTIGKYALVGSGTVVTKDIPDFALVVGNPGKFVGWVDKKGNKWGEGIKLQSTKLEEMPKYIIENAEKYRPWLDS